MATLTQLRRQLRAALEKARDDTAKQLEELESELAAMNGEAPTVRTKPSAKRKPAKRSKRPKNDKPLREYVEKALQNRQLDLAGIASRILKAGYKTTSKNFNNTLYQCLYNMENVVHDKETGKYKMK